MTAPQNRLIEVLPASERLQLLSVAEPVVLAPAEVLCEAGAATRHAWFPVDAFIVLVMGAPGHPALEAGMVGREGMVGTQLVLGVEAAPLRALVQGGGTAWRIEAGVFARLLARTPALRRSLCCYVQAMMTQAARSAACVRYHLIGPRLARWLLMSQDRADADGFRVTHQYLSTMLGVRRVGVTTAAVALQRAGLIDYHRGEVQVLDRAGLEAVACACYQEDRRSYARLLPKTCCERSPATATAPVAKALERTS